MVKGDVKEVEEGMLRKTRVNARIPCCGRKVADLKIYLFSATKQDRVSPSLQSRNSFVYICGLLYTLYSGTGSVI